MPFIENLPTKFSANYLRTRGYRPTPYRQFNQSERESGAAQPISFILRNAQSTKVMSRSPGIEKRGGAGTPGGVV
jgi:hypothetical protein